MFGFVCVSVCIFVFTVFAVPNLGRDPHLKECYFSPPERTPLKQTPTLLRLEFGNSEKNPWNFLTFLGNFWMGTSIASWWSFWGEETLEPSAQDPFLGRKKSVHLPFTTCASQQKKWLQSHRTWCNCNVKMDSFVETFNKREGWTFHPVFFGWPI